MIDLYGNRANETYTYRLVDWDTWQEGEDLGSVVSGSVELSAYSDLKASMKMEWRGDAPPRGSIVRVYYSFDDDAGEHAEYAIGTFLVSYTSSTYEDGGASLVSSGTADGYSVLKVLKDRLLGMPVSVDAGEQPVAKAVEAMQSVGLRVNVAEESSYALSSGHTFEPSDSMLAYVNWCLTAAGYQAVSPDAYGICQVAPYMEPSRRAVVASFADDENSIMYPEVGEDNDWRGTPNVVRVYYEDESIAMYAAARNVSGSLSSLASNGMREITRYESVSEAEDLAALEAHALKVLLDNSNEIERVKFAHPYVPITAFDAVRIDYSDRSWSGNVQNMSVRLSPSTKCETTLRRFVSPAIVTEVEGGILWEGGEQ